MGTTMVKTSDIKYFRFFTLKNVDDGREALDIYRNWKTFAVYFEFLVIQYPSPFQFC
jgi:hypothetical protein